MSLAAGKLIADRLLNARAATDAHGRWVTLSIMGCLVGSAIAIALAPLVLASDYSWIQHTISESGAQGVRGAWAARLGFLLFGLAVLALAQTSRMVWGPLTTFLFRFFAIAMLAVATFAHRPWGEDAAFDGTEDLLHSIAATTMGFAIILGALTRSFSRPRSAVTPKLVDFSIVLVGTLVPWAMLGWPHLAGALQRGMFTCAYVWFAREALRLKDPAIHASRLSE